MTDQEINLETPEGTAVIHQSSGQKMVVIGKEGEDLICQWLYRGKETKANFNPKALVLAKNSTKYASPVLVRK